jgi:hypothetical protein
MRKTPERKNTTQPGMEHLIKKALHSTQDGQVLDLSNEDIFVLEDDTVIWHRSRA